MHAHRRDFLFSSLLAAGALARGDAAHGQPGAPVARRIWGCPSCGCTADGEVFYTPGACPECDMPLVELTQVLEGRTKVAILIYPGVQVIDFAAPLEVFGQAGYWPFTVAASKAPLAANMQLRITPTFAFADCPPADVLMIPGGTIAGPRASPETLAWIKARSAQSRFTLTVCNGSLIAAQAGILDGLAATTFYNAIEELRQSYPRVTSVSDRRFVDNGKVITSAGLSAGIDAALHLVSKLSSPAAAQLAALNMEYDWKPDGSYARAAFADYPLRQALGNRLELPLPGGIRAILESTAGDRRVWNATWRVETASSPAEVAKAVEAVFAGRGAPAAQASGAARRVWRMIDPRTRTWLVELDVTQRAGVKRARISSRLAS
jgi:putative intracellular protease/amidase